MTTPHDDANGHRDAALREAFASLPKETAPPADLEDKIVSALKRRGDIRGDGVWRNRWMAAVLAAALVSFVAGLGIGLRTGMPGPPAGTAAATTPRWVLLLYEDDDYQAPPLAEKAARIREYGAWAHTLATRGTLVAGEKLNESGKLLARARVGVEVDDGLPMSGEGVLAGYFVIRAGSLDEAIALASNCPHLRYGGRIALRRIDPT